MPRLRPKKPTKRNPNPNGAGNAIGFFRKMRRIRVLRRNVGNTGKFLYLVRCGNSYKIGITTNFKARLRTLQQSNAFRVVPILLINNSKNDAIEKGIKIGWESKKIRGEWFHLTKKDICELKCVLDEVVKKYGQ